MLQHILAVLLIASTPMVEIEAKPVEPSTQWPCSLTGPSSMLSTISPTLGNLYCKARNWLGRTYDRIQENLWQREVETLKSIKIWRSKPEDNWWFQDPQPESSIFLYKPYRFFQRWHRYSAPTQPKTHQNPELPAPPPVKLWKTAWTLFSQLTNRLHGPPSNRTLRGAETPQIQSSVSKEPSARKDL